MLKKPASGVLASLRGLNVPHTGEELFRQLGVGRVRMQRLASSLAAALLDELFEHPAREQDGRDRNRSFEF